MNKVELNKSVKIKSATSLMDRLVGLMFKKQIDFDALEINPCQSVHCFFMKFPIDVVFMNEDHVVIKIYREMNPWSISGYHFRAKKVLEFKLGVMPFELREGDKLEYQVNV